MKRDKGDRHRRYSLRRDPSPHTERTASGRVGAATQTIEADSLGTEAHLSGYIISSHDLGQVTGVSDRISILEVGEIARYGPTDPDTLMDDLLHRDDSAEGARTGVTRKYMP